MILYIISVIINVLIWIIIAYAVLSWFPSINRRNPIAVLIQRIVDPVLNPIRRIIPPEKTGYIDVAPIVAILALQVILVVLQSVLVASH